MEDDRIKPYFTNKEVRQILLQIGIVVSLMGFVVGYITGWWLSP